MPSSGGSSQPRDQTHISDAGRFLTTSTTWEALLSLYICLFWILDIIDGDNMWSFVTISFNLAQCVQCAVACISTSFLFIAEYYFIACCCYCCQVASVVSDSVRPHRRQPTRLPCPWDSPGKSTGVGCHFFLQCMKVKSESEVAQSCLTPSDPMDRSPPGSSVHGIFQARVLEWGAIALSTPHFLYPVISWQPFSLFPPCGY